ncbi:hypothetical protein [Streptosporangium saharense]
MTVTVGRGSVATPPVSPLLEPMPTPISKATSAVAPYDHQRRPRRGG